MDLGLKGLRAIVTGSTAGIGRAIAQNLAREGADVAICSRQQENVDATITPRYMANQGVQLKTKVRYLTEKHQGSIGIEYLNEDQSEPELNERYLFNWQQVTNFNDDWRASIDVTNVSDDNYLTDLESDFANKTDTQLYRTGLLTHFGNMWQTDIKVQNFEVLGDHLASYSAMPQITFNQPVPNRNTYITRVL